MHQSRKYVALTGVLFWLALAVIAIAAVRGPAAPTATDSPIRQILDYAVRRPRTYPAQLPGQPVGRADPIFLTDAAGRWVQVGHVAALAPPADAKVVQPSGAQSSAANAQIVWYDNRRDLSAYRLEAYRSRGTLEEIVQTMLPAEKRERIRRALAEALQLHGDEIADAFRPVVEQSLRDSVPVLEDALRQSVARHRDEFQSLGRRWEDELLKQQIIPLVRDEVLPTVQQHAEPLAQEIGRDLWDRASLWRFGWRALYDKTPLPDQQLTRKEWDRFVQEEVVPVLQSRTDQIVEAQRRILVDLARNPRLRSRMGDVFEQMIDDPQLQTLISQVVREAVIDNRQLHEVWTRNWKSPEARAAMRLSGQRLEPVIRQLGDELFGTKEAGVDPDFARVLRNQILGKDRRWVIAVPADTPAVVGPAGEPTRPAMVIHQGRGQAQFPLVMMAAGETQE